MCVRERKTEREREKWRYVLESGAQELEKQKVNKREKIDIGVGVRVLRRKNNQKKKHMDEKKN